MSARMVSRGGKTRFFGFVCMVLVFSAILYVFHETQVELDNVRHSSSSCSHQLESISSQLQVIVEHKLKLERSLEDEKQEHLKTKDELNAIIQDEKQLRDKQNVDSMNRYNEIERNHEVLQEEEKKIRRELETLKLNYIGEKKKSAQLAFELDNVKMQLQNFINEKVKLKSEKENIENYQNNNLLNSKEISDTKYVQMSSDNSNVTKLKSGSVTPAINPQAIDDATAKSSTPMISSKVMSDNKTQLNEKDNANPINQPSIDPSSINLSNIAMVSQNENNLAQESQVNENEIMKAMAAPPQEEILQKEQPNNNEEDKLPKPKNNSYDDEAEQFKEDEDDEDMNDFDAREESQPVRQ
uniref:Golgi integral membrane protein 4 n=1 Tax=Sipha flava TaxID=143950 RepID=A0A2S2R4H3_9HEMI